MDWRVGPTDLESVIATSVLQKRGSARQRLNGETEILLRLTHELAREPERIFQRLVAAITTMTRAGSSGISLLNEAGDTFVWPAIAGPLSRFIGDGTPRAFGPCGTVLDRNQTLLMIRPQRHFEYLQAISPALEEVLLVPFHVDGRAVGTLWAISHSDVQHFDAEDRRVLEDLSAFVASAYQTLLRAGSIQSYLRVRHSRDAR